MAKTIYNRVVQSNSKDPRKDLWITGGNPVKLLRELKDRLEKGMETAGQKSQQVLEISRLSYKIKGKKEDIDRLYRRLGQAVSEAWETQTNFMLNASMRELLEAIRDLKQQVEILEQELLDVKGKRACSGCGTVIDKELETCPSCGKTFSVHEYISPGRSVHNNYMHSSGMDSPGPERKTVDATPDSKSNESEKGFREYTLSSIKMDMSSDDHNTNSTPQPESNSNIAASVASSASSQSQNSTGYEEIVVCPGCGIQIDPRATRCDTCGEVFFQTI